MARRLRVGWLGRELKRDQGISQIGQESSADGYTRGRKRRIGYLAKWLSRRSRTAWINRNDMVAFLGRHPLPAAKAMRSKLAV